MKSAKSVIPQGGRIIPRQTPWSNWNEWYNVYQLAYSQSIEERKEAISWMKLWTSRGNNPTAVESTCSLIELLILYRSKSAQITQSVLRLLFSMALVRFVNGIVDQSQRATFALSVNIFFNKKNMN